MTEEGGKTEPSEPMKVQVAGLTNVFRVSPHLYSGSGPEDANVFAELAKLGIKTIISVDGAKPKIAAARRAGLRYVHIPIGYNGVPRERVLQLARAMRELPGPFYIHCHHGKHRGPCATAIAQLCADDRCTITDAVKLLKLAGTDPRYQGLFESVEKLSRPTKDEWKKSAPLEEMVRVADLTQAMVAIDSRYDHLKLAQKASWRTPKDHPDIDPAHEALQLLEHFKELRRQPTMMKKPADFQTWLRMSEESTQSLELLLRQAKDTKSPNVPTADSAFAQITKACFACHAQYRDVCTTFERQAISVTERTAVALGGSP